jgi:hypothetical protein
MNKTPVLLALLTLTGALVSTVPDASAQGRVRGRGVAHAADGGRVAATRAAGHGERGAYARGRNVYSDGQGNIDGRSRAYASSAAGGTAQRQDSFYRNADGSAGRQGSASVYGANGGTAQRQHSAYRNADGSAGRQRSASVNGANGGTAYTSGSLARDADGNIDGSRSTSATGRNGNSYNGATTLDNGVVTHSHTCTNAAGDAIACRRN